MGPRFMIWSSFNGRSMAGSMVPARLVGCGAGSSFQWPKYGRVDGAFRREAENVGMTWVSMAEVWPGRWCACGAACRLPLRVSMAEVWPGRWCYPDTPESTLCPEFQWPKYGRVDGAPLSCFVDAARVFQWPKYGRVDGAAPTSMTPPSYMGFNGRSMAGSMVPAVARVPVQLEDNVSMAEVWPGRWCRVPG